LLGAIGFEFGRRARSINRQIAGTGIVAGCKVDELFAPKQQTEQGVPDEAKS
jgi:hypothetical protein